MSAMIVLRTASIFSTSLASFSGKFPFLLGRRQRDVDARARDEVALVGLEFGTADSGLGVQVGILVQPLEAAGGHVGRGDAPYASGPVGCGPSRSPVPASSSGGGVGGSGRSG
ncbi:MAG: hypothetical protein R3F37_16650 [Candidatus Competibacteraceae bacterium]